MSHGLSNFAAHLRELIQVLVPPAPGQPGGHSDSEHESRNSDHQPGLACASARLRRDPQAGGSDREFQALALELFGLQFEGNAAYRKFCLARRATPLTVSCWRQIPALPTAAFKEFEQTCLAPSERTRVFHSSGTTEHRPSRHFHGASSLAVYDASAWGWFVPHVVPDIRFVKSKLRPFSLTPPPAQAPQSSLVHMFERVREGLGADERFYLGRVANGDWTLDLDECISRLDSAGVGGGPVLLLGTAFSFVHLLDGLAARGRSVRLPAGSRVLETGGYKGRSRTLPKTELHRLISARLGVAPTQILCEYGMSELSSQAYDNATAPSAPIRRDPVANDQRADSEIGAPSASRFTLHISRSFRFPPWARAQIISPETGQEVADGETGLIRVFDLANVYSVMAVQTEDVAVRRGGGFELLGRALHFEPRGCSVMTSDS